jgi:glycine reductase
MLTINNFVDLRKLIFKKKKGDSTMLKGKKVAILGDRDGIPGPAIEECVKSAGAEVVFSTTECFV